MWRMHPEPVVALDGDKAGLRAAFRVIDLAMPLLQAGQSLRFALMPEGKDPDDLIKEEGRAGMRAVLEAAVPMVTLLWQRETEGKIFDSPERRAMLDKSLRAAITPIKDASIKRHYGEILNDMRWELFQSKRTQSGDGAGFSIADLSEPAVVAPVAPSYDGPPDDGGYERGYEGGYGDVDAGYERSYDEAEFTPAPSQNAPQSGSNFKPNQKKEARPKREWDPKTRSFRLPAVPAESTKSSTIAAFDESHADFVREAVVLATALLNPGITLEFISQLEALHPETQDHASLLHALLTHAEEDDAQALWQGVLDICGAPVLERLMAHPHVKITPPVLRPNLQTAQMCLTEELAKLKARRGYSAELSDGILDMVEAGDEKVTWRLAQAAEARNRATKAEAEDRVEYDIAENGTEMKREERASFHRLLESLTSKSNGEGDAK
jgi:DNA primase